MCLYVSLSLFLSYLSVVHICVHMDAHVTQHACDTKRQITGNFVFLYFLGTMNPALILSISGKQGTTYLCLMSDSIWYYRFLGSPCSAPAMEVKRLTIDFTFPFSPSNLILQSYLQLPKAATYFLSPSYVDYSDLLLSFSPYISLF